MADKPIRSMQLFYLGLFAGLIPIVNILTILILDLTDSPPVTQLSQHSTIFVIFVTVCLLPAIWEELLFRGIIQTLLLRFGAIVAITLTSGLFTALHFGNPHSLPAVFILSIALSVAMFLFNNIFYVMLLHFINNSFGYIIFLLNRYIDSETAYLATLLLYAIFILSSVVILSFGRHRCPAEILDLWKRHSSRLQKQQNKKRFR